MKIIDTSIPDVKIIEPAVFADDRGFFLESFNQQRFNEAIGHEISFVQDNHSRSSQGVLRGLHYQLAPKAQGKLVRVTHGEVFDVVVDMRQNSPTFSQWTSVILSDENKQQLWIPEGFAHGFYVLSETADFLYKTTNYYSSVDERSLKWDDATIAIDWPLIGAPLISDKDMQAMLFIDSPYFDDDQIKEKEPAKAENHYIKPNYKNRIEYNHYNDQIEEDGWQLEVYLHAFGLMKKHSYRTVLDFGCGSGYKLIKYLGDYQTIGVELEANLEFLKTKYPDRVWLESDFNAPIHLNTDVLICSDVIEHLVDPNQLIQYLQKISFEYLVLSTPDRDLVYEADSPFLDGPPRNPAHVREWSFSEFKDYVSQYFDIIEHRITHIQQATQMMVCKKRSHS